MTQDLPPAEAAVVDQSGGFAVQRFARPTVAGARAPVAQMAVILYRHACTHSLPLQATLPCRLAHALLAAAFGCSVLYHLARIGWRDRLLLDKNELTSGATWHAATGVMTLNSDAKLFHLRRYTFDLHPDLEAETRLSCGIHHSGCIYLVASDRLMDFLKLIQSRVRYLKM